MTVEFNPASWENASQVMAELAARLEGASGCFAVPGVGGPSATDRAALQGSDLVFERAAEVLPMLSETVSSESQRMAETARSYQAIEDVNQRIAHMVQQLMGEQS